MASVKRNLFYNLLLVVSNIAYPLIVFPYVSRILGPQGIGESQFALSFARYFTLVASAGIPVYGVREVARLRNNQEGLAKLFKEIMWIGIFSSLVCFVCYASVITVVDSFKPYATLCWIAGLQIILSFTSIEWFFFGSEQFKTIAFRSIVMKIVTMIAIFAIVQTSEDVLYYLSISIVSILIYQIWNMKELLTIFSIKSNELNIKQHLQPLIIIFATGICISFYTAFDTTLVGLLDTKNEVGFYATALRVAKMGIPIVSSLSIVIIPKVVEEFNKPQADFSYLQKSFAFIVELSIPIAFGVYLLAPELIYVLAGDSFMPTVLAIQLLCPITLLVGLNNLFGTQILSSSGNEKLLFYAVLIGTFISVGLNILLIPYFHHFGASLVAFITELAVTILTYYWVQKKFSIAFPFRKIGLSILICLPFILVVIALRVLGLTHLYILGLSIFICALWYLGIQVFVLKNYLWVALVQKLEVLFGIKRDGK